MYSCKYRIFKNSATLSVCGVLECKGTITYHNLTIFIRNILIASIFLSSPIALLSYLYPVYIVAISCLYPNYILLPSLAYPSYRHHSSLLPIPHFLFPLYFPLWHPSSPSSARGANADWKNKSVATTAPAEPSSVSDSSSRSCSARSSS